MVVESPHRNRTKGNLYHTAIYLSVPGHDIEVTREPQLQHAHEDVFVSIRDSFREATRQLEDHVRKRQHRVKHHETPLHGRVVRMFADYGFILTSDEREVYFHRNSVAGGDFDKLEAGDEVRFSEDLGEKAPQATAVTPVGKHHILPAAFPHRPATAEREARRSARS